MTGKVAISFALSAVGDIEDIRQWYAEQDVPEVGEKIIRSIFHSIERLAKFPKSGRTVPEFGVQYLREIVSPPFRIVYRLDGNSVRIVRVWRSERVLTVTD